MQAAAREQFVPLVLRENFVQLRVENVLLAEVVMADQILEHPLLVEELVRLATAGERSGDESPERLLGRLQIPKDVPVLQREEVRISPQDFSYPAPVDRKKVGLLRVHVDSEVPFELFQFGKRASELEADHEVSVNGEAFMEPGVDFEEFKQGAHGVHRSAVGEGRKRRASFEPREELDSIRGSIHIERGNFRIVGSFQRGM